jgi:hypothetical protein
VGLHQVEDTDKDDVGKEVDELAARLSLAGGDALREGLSIGNLVSVPHGKTCLPLQGKTFLKEIQAVVNVRQYRSSGAVRIERESDLGVRQPEFRGRHELEQFRRRLAGSRPVPEPVGELTR